MILILLILLFNNAVGQTFKQQFKDLLSKKDTIGEYQLLEKWEIADINDPELYVAYFNYYVNKSKKDVIELGNNPKGDFAYKLTNTDTTKKTISYMYGNTYYDPYLLKKGFEYADKGIAKNPTRLDIRFGKVFMFGKLENYKDFTDEIIKTINYSVKINNNWIWTDNKPVDNPKQFMLSSIQSYQEQLYNTNNDELLDNMKQIAEAVLKYYPNHVESLSNLAIVLFFRKDYDKALEELLKAEKLAPTDFIVLNNIAQAYKYKGDSNNAIIYYNLTIKYGDEQAKEYAKRQIEELKRK